MNIKDYQTQFPVTTGLLIINGVIFILNLIGFSAYTISHPGIINSGTFLAHLSHIEPLHMLMNMVILYRLGPLLETQLKSPQFFNLFLVLWFGLVGLLFWVQDAPIVGFSGILMGMICFLMFLSRGMNKQFSQSLLFLLGLNIFVGFFPRVSFWGHLGGALVGLCAFGVYRLWQNK